MYQKNYLSDLKDKCSETKFFANFLSVFSDEVLDFFYCIVNSEWPFPRIWEEPFVTRLAGEFDDAPSSVDRQHVRIDIRL